MSAPIVAKAFEIGRDIAERGDGYHFEVFTDGGHVFRGVPEATRFESILCLDLMGGMPNPVIDVRRIVAITVHEVE